MQDLDESEEIPDWYIDYLLDREIEREFIATEAEQREEKP